jgi:hypothetical protein
VIVRTRSVMPGCEMMNGADHPGKTTVIVSSPRSMKSHFFIDILPSVIFLLRYR